MEDREEKQEKGDGKWAKDNIIEHSDNNKQLSNNERVGYKASNVLFLFFTKPRLTKDELQMFENLQIAIRKL